MTSTPSYVSFLKKNGIKNSQGNKWNGEQKRFSCSLYWIIQEKYGQELKIFDLTDKNISKNSANKIALTILESNRNEIEKHLEEITFCRQYDKNFNSDLIKEYNNELLRWANKSFTRYLREINNYHRFIAIRNKQDPTKRHFVSIENRYSKSYQNKVRKRMNWVIHKYKNTQAVSVILTIDPKIYAYDKYLMWTTIKDELNRFLTDLRYYFEKRGLSFPKYICSIESQNGRAENNYIAKGNPHIHIVFLGCKRILDWRKIKDLWSLGRIWINRTIEGHHIRYPINYITKYITKTFTETNEKNCLTQSLCWLFNVRSFSTSRGLIFPLKYVSDEWEALLLIIIPKRMSPIDVFKEIEMRFFPKCLDNPPTISV